MQDYKNRFDKKIFLLISVLFSFSMMVTAQVSSVEFGKNRIQYKKMKWNYYQSLNFNAYYNQNGEELGKFVLQVAEEVLPEIERFVEYTLQKRGNIII